jgi:hypothetical protein
MPSSTFDARAVDENGATPYVELHRVQNVGNYRVHLDLGPQVLGLSLPISDPLADFRKGAVNLSARSRSDEFDPCANEAPLMATIPELCKARPYYKRQNFVSAAVLAQKGKQFDDGLYAAVELMAQRGGGSFGGKAAMLAALVPRLSEDTDAACFLGGAALLGDVHVTFPNAACESGAHEVARKFNEPQAKPLGFYTWSAELAAIFRQDRLLQTEISSAPLMLALTNLLHKDAAARSVYEGYLQLMAGMTNPLSTEHPDLRPLLAALDRGERPTLPPCCRFFPPSVSHEGKLVQRLYGNRPIPPGFSLIDALIQAVRKGEVDLRPREESGFYDHQTWALEPLLVPERIPEAARLRLDDGYRKHLEGLFRGLLTLTRETHMKQVVIPAPVSAPPPPKSISVFPPLGAEPLCTYYLRRALSYRFVARVLEKSFGAETLRVARRLRAEGPVERPLLEELAAMATLFHGACLTTADELGLAENLAWPEADGSEARSAFRAFAQDQTSDQDLAQDARMMVPVFYDRERKQTKVWLFLGWSYRPLDIRFVHAPGVQVFDASGADVTQEVQVKLEQRRCLVAYPVSAEVYVSKLLDRAQFRRLCDEKVARKAILAALI